MGGEESGGETSTFQVTHRLDVLGFFCPVPVSEAKQALSQLANGDILEVVADDPETLHDMPLVLGRTTHQILEVREQAGEYFFVIEVVK